MKKHQKQIFALAVTLVFTTTAILLTGLSEAGKPEKSDPVMDMLEEIYSIVLDTNSKLDGVVVPKTGQTTSYATGDDGDLQKGEDWPNPRFFDNGDGTVTDYLTGLIWLKNADRFGPRNWTTALSDCNSLADDGVNLTDGSSAGDWRLPNIRELQSLIHYEYYNPAVPNTAGTGQWSSGDPFTNVRSAFYWSSCTYMHSTTTAWYVNGNEGEVGASNKLENYYRVWPVRGGN